MGMELIFEVRDTEERGFYALWSTPSSPKPTPWAQLRANVFEATSLHFDEEPVHARLVR